MKASDASQQQGEPAQMDPIFCARGGVYPLQCNLQNRQLGERGNGGDNSTSDLSLTFASWTRSSRQTMMCAAH